MKVFKISGKLQQDARYTDLPEDFKGYFVLKENSQEIKGYIEDQYKSEYDPVKYIFGMYDEIDSKMVFLKMANEQELLPELYTFPNLEKAGTWHKLAFMFGVFSLMGETKVTIEEVTENVEELSKKTLEVYNQVLDGGLELNAKLIEVGVETYMKNLNS